MMDRALKERIIGAAVLVLVVVLVVPLFLYVPPAEAELEEGGHVAVAEIAVYAEEVNAATENIGARRLATILERLLEPYLFDAPQASGEVRWFQRPGRRFLLKITPLDLGTSWWVIALCFVLDDLRYYWVHRFGHRIRWVWASHVNHHSSQHYNLTTALRQTWTGTFTFMMIVRAPLILLGFHPAMVLFCGGLNLIYQFWIHTEAIGRMPRWFEAVMNTPSHHRVHHATNPRYLDRNYAGVFIVWDKMFGTFEPETDEERIRYGIVKQLGSFNLLWAVFHEWIGMIRNIRAAIPDSDFMPAPTMD